MTYRGSRFIELDLEAVLARRPELALVDESAYPAGRWSHAKRWHAEELLGDLGPEGHVTKQFDVDELLARWRVAVQR